MDISSIASQRVDIPLESKVEEAPAAQGVPPVSLDSLQATEAPSWSFSCVKIMVIATVAVGIFAVAAFVAKYLFRQEDRAQDLEAKVQYYKEQMRMPSSSS